jgi:hypothetical protein
LSALATARTAGVCRVYVSDGTYVSRRPCSKVGWLTADEEGILETSRSTALTGIRAQRLSAKESIINTITESNGDEGESEMKAKEAEKDQEGCTPPGYDPKTWTRVRHQGPVILEKTSMTQKVESGAGTPPISTIPKHTGITRRPARTLRGQMLIREEFDDE